MLLLYLVAVGSTFTSSAFTFHYASTISPHLCRTQQRCWTLHSTMLLLYLWKIVWFSNLAFLYIPLCFYYIFFADCFIVGINHLYIPLCFYYIKRPRGRTTDPWRNFTFHYASTISKLESDTEEAQKPLHSTMLLLYLLGLMNLL